MSIPFSYTQEVRLHLVFPFVPSPHVQLDHKPNIISHVRYLNLLYAYHFCVSKPIIHSLYILHTFTPVPSPFFHPLHPLHLCSSLSPLSPLSFLSMFLPSMFPSVPSLHLPQSLLLFFHALHPLYPFHLCSFHPLHLCSPPSMFPSSPLSLFFH